VKSDLCSDASCSTCFYIFQKGIYWISCCFEWSKPFSSLLLEWIFFCRTCDLSTTQMDQLPRCPEAQAVSYRIQTPWLLSISHSIGCPFLYRIQIPRWTNDHTLNLVAPSQHKSFLGLLGFDFLWLFGGETQESCQTVCVFTDFSHHCFYSLGYFVLKCRFLKHMENRASWKRSG
jgi:hypothetical protein